MNEYDLIYEELCERVECGELSLEDAEIINDVAYDRYVNEANVYDKLVDKHAAAARKEYDKARRLEEIQSQYRKDDPQRSRYEDKIVAADIRGAKQDYDKSLFIHPNRKPDDMSTANVIQNKRICANVLNTKGKIKTNEYGIRKKEWMRTHGNVGKTPEERYTAGRYQYIQNGK